MKYVLLTRAKKNVGDFLILDRAKRLIKKYKGKDFIVLQSWKPLDNYLKIINDSDAVIICGGPGIQPNFYPNVYPLIKNLEDISVPIILFGIGWCGFPGDDVSLKLFRFTSTSLMALRKICDSYPIISCRDYLTAKVLVDNGFTKVLMTGCPSWYVLEYLDKPFKPPDKIEKVVFTVPQRVNYHGQAIGVMRLLKKMFPNAELICSFHRGWRSDKYTSRMEAERLSSLRRAALNLGFRVVNAAYDISKIEFYKDCDLHVGYRLHGHIYFLSYRKPSFLLSEDSRGIAFSKTLGLPSIQAWELSRLGEFYSKLIGNVKLPFTIADFAESMRRRLVKASYRAVNELKQLLQKELESGFEQFNDLEKVFRKHFEKVVRFLKSLP